MKNGHRMILKNTFQYIILLMIKYVSKIFYRYKVTCFSALAKEQWHDIHLIIFLNHTSLYEPIFVAVPPNKFLWHLSKNLIVPAADTTMERPVVGRFLSLLIPGFIPISRKKDHTWDHFLEQIEHGKVTAILPEGRMKRRTGLDKDGKPMTIKPGVVDILERLSVGNILFAYSGGLHHIQAPGERFPRVFKKVSVGLETISIMEYKKQIKAGSGVNFRAKVLADLEKKLKACADL